MSLDGDNISDSKGQFGSDIGTTYFSYSGPNSFDAATTTNLDDDSNELQHPHLRQENSNGSMGRNDGTTRSVESLHLSPSEAGDRDIITVPPRSRPFRDQNVLFLAPPYPGYGYGYPGVYNPAFYPPPLPPPPTMAPPAVPYDPSWRTTSDDCLPLKRSENPYRHLKHMTMKHFTIFIAVMFLLAFVAVIFTAVYYGHRIV